MKFDEQNQTVTSKAGVTIAVGDVVSLPETDEAEVVAVGPYGMKVMVSPNMQRTVPAEEVDRFEPSPRVRR